MVKAKLLAYTDTRAEALQHQRRFHKRGIITLINKEYGGYAVKTIGSSKKKIVIKKVVKRKKVEKNIFGF